MWKGRESWILAKTWCGLRLARLGRSGFWEVLNARMGRVVLFGRCWFFGKSKTDRLANEVIWGMRQIVRSQHVLPPTSASAPPAATSEMR